MEYNAKTRLGIWACFLMMLLVLVLLSAEAVRNAKAQGGAHDDDAVYVNATPATLPPAETTPRPTFAQSTDTEQGETTASATDASENELPSGSPRALYYVTVRAGAVVLLDADGNILRTVNENAEFLPRGDLATLRNGVAIYTEEELAALMDDLG